MNIRLTYVTVFETVIKMVTIKGSYVGNRKDTGEALDFYRRGLIKAPYKVSYMVAAQHLEGTSKLTTIR